MFKYLIKWFWKTPSTFLSYYYIFERITYRINDESNETHKYGKDLPRIILKKIINLY